MQQELYHEIFGSILDRTEMTPYLLRNRQGYLDALHGTDLMLSNRGFELQDGALAPGELDRGAAYVNQARSFVLNWLVPALTRQFRDLANLKTPREDRYREALGTLERIGALMREGAFAELVAEDPRHLFLLSSSAKYPTLFKGYPGGEITVPRQWKLGACALLKTCHLIKSVEEDSQDIHDYACFALHLKKRGLSLTNLWALDWENPALEPPANEGHMAYMKVRSFFRKLRLSLDQDPDRGCWVFDSGDGVRVDVEELKARLKSPESMFTKLGKDDEESSSSIRDILALTFIIRRREDSLTLFHALQKRGVILQENTRSASLTQTLFDSPRDMQEAVRELMRNLNRSAHLKEEPDPGAVREEAELFFAALGANEEDNPHSSDRHRKIQCKISVSLPVRKDGPAGPVSQQTLPVELRISDRASWEESEKRGAAHHEAYKFRQLVVLADRLFKPLFRFGEKNLAGLREDQERLFG